MGINNIEELIEDYGQIKRSFRLSLEKDLQKILELMSKEPLIQTGWHDFMLKDRHVVWMKKIREALKEEENNKLTAPQVNLKYLELFSL